MALGWAGPEVPLLALPAEAVGGEGQGGPLLAPPRPGGVGAGTATPPAAGAGGSACWWSPAVSQHPHLPQEGQVPGKGALVQGVVVGEEDPWALGKEAEERWVQKQTRGGKGVAGKGEVGMNACGQGRVLSPVTRPRTALG